MAKVIPQIVKEVGFDFDWDVEKVWKLGEPVSEIDTAELLWHFAIPFLWEGDKATTPQEILTDPQAHPNEYSRMLAADTTHPIDIMEHKGRWLILDGLHRLMKLYTEGKDKIRVRKIPRSRISEIIRH